jgi:hypothetical protein
LRAVTGPLDGIAQQLCHDSCVERRPVVEFDPLAQPDAKTAAASFPVPILGETGKHTSVGGELRQTFATETSRKRSDAELSAGDGAFGRSDDELSGSRPRRRRARTRGQEEEQKRNAAR